MKSFQHVYWKWNENKKKRKEKEIRCVLYCNVSELSLILFTLSCVSCPYLPFPLATCCTGRQWTGSRKLRTQHWAWWWDPCCKCFVYIGHWLCMCILVQWASDLTQHQGVNAKRHTLNFFRFFLEKLSCSCVFGWFIVYIFSKNEKV